MLNPALLPSRIPAGRDDFLVAALLSGMSPRARAMEAARQQHAAMLAQQAASPQLSSLSAAWQPIGPEPGCEHCLRQRHGPGYGDCD